MKLWLIKARDEIAVRRNELINPWYNPWDMYLGFVIRAESLEQARRTAAENAGDEGPGPWLDPELTSCDELTADGEPGIVLSDFSAG